MREEERLAEAAVLGHRAQVPPTSHLSTSKLIGAGVSVDSGISAYRGEGGHYSEWSAILERFSS